MSLLALSDIEVRYRGRRGDPGVQAVAGVTLELERGQVIGLAGESGCGKSTLARVAVGLQEPTAGSVSFEDEPVQLRGAGTRPPRQSRLQMVFQDPYSSLNPRRRVGQQIADAFVIHGRVGDRDRGSRVASLLERVGLPTDAAHRYPSEFSGGQRQRIALARVLAAQPTALVLDEPFAALDTSSQAQGIDVLGDLRQTERMGMLLISHDLGVVRETADLVAIMYLGRIVEIAPPERLWDAPQHPYSEALIAAIPTVDAGGRMPRTLPGEVPDPSNPPSGCPFHPRCPYTFDRCPKDRPPLARLDAERRAACWLRIDSSVEAKPASEEVS